MKKREVKGIRLNNLIIMKKKFFDIDKERKERARPKTKIIQSNTFYVTEKKIINLIRSIKTDCEKN